MLLHLVHLADIMFQLHHLQLRRRKRRDHLPGELHRQVLVMENHLHMPMILMHHFRRRASQRHHQSQLPLQLLDIQITKRLLRKMD
jgi:hypothetical protein